MKNITPKEQVDSFDYKLASPIKYADSGSTLETDTIQLVAPGANLYIKAFKLSQIVNIASMKAITIFKTMGQLADSGDRKAIEEAKKAKEEKAVFDPKKDGEDVRTLIITSDLDMEKAIDLFSGLASAGCILVEGNKLNFIQWAAIGEPDKVEMFFQFVGVFIMPSLFSA